MACAGCGADRHGGRLVAQYPRARLPVFGYTESRGDYVLFARQDTEGWANAVNVGDGWRLGTWRLKKRSPLGFKTVDGRLVAVAGRDEIPLPPGSYCWHVRPGSTPVDWVSTAFAVVAVVGIGVFAVAAWWASEWNSGWNMNYPY